MEEGDIELRCHSLSAWRALDLTWLFRVVLKEATGLALIPLMVQSFDVGFPWKVAMFLGEEAFFSRGQFLGRCQLRTAPRSGLAVGEEECLGLEESPGPCIPPISTVILSENSSPKIMVHLLLWEYKREVIGLSPVSL